MKLVTLLIFAGIMQIHAASYSQNTFNLRESNISVKELFRKIEKNSNYTLFYRQDQIDLNKKVNLSLENAGIDAVMSQVLKGQSLTYEVVDNMIVIKSTEDTADMRDFTISGTVTDQKGEPLIGASVGIKGTTRGTSTDINGKFALRVEGDNAVTLVVKYIGFQQQEIDVKAGQTNVAIKLVSSAAQLDEVVVIGYGAVKRRDLTGSVVSVKSEDIVRTPTHNVLEAIQGRAPGVDVVRSSGSAGSGVTLTVRGTRTLNGSISPLYIVDGVQGVDINSLNPSDIESLEVLKDASSTAIYGSQGANGVIIVTTKKGKAGKAAISYSAYYGVNGFTSYPKGRTGDDYIKLRTEAYRASNLNTDYNNIFSETERAAIEAGQWVDWIDLVMQNGSQQNHTLSVRGGTEQTKYFLSTSYFREEGYVRNNDFNRYNLRFNLDQKINKWAQTGVISQISYSNLNSRKDPLSVASSIAPLGTPYDQNGQIVVYPIAGNTTAVSPLTDERQNAAVDNTKANLINAIGYIELKPIKGLSFRSNLGTNFSLSRRGVFNDASSLAQNNVKYSAASVTNSNTRFYNWDNILNYTIERKGHSVTATAITSYTNSNADQESASGIKQLLSSQLFYNLFATEAASRSITSTYTASETMAYAARLNYSFKGKYLLTATGRYDGASRLSVGHKWDFFPSIAGAWNIYQEDFMKKLDFVSNLKLRASYGVAGNSGIKEYGTQSGLTAGSIGLGGSTAEGMYQYNTTVGNPDLGWEKSATTDIGADVGLFQNRVSLNFSWYNTNTKDILQLRTLPLSTGMTDVYQNIASSRNRGVDLTINTQNIKGKDFNWNTTFTFSRNKEKITGLINNKDVISGSNPEEQSLLLGRPLHSFYTYKKLGIWQTDEAEQAAQVKFGGTAFKPGDIKLADISGPNGTPDGVIDATYDRVYLGSIVPDWFGGLQNNFRYKNLDLGIYLFARWGQMMKAEFLGRYNPSGTGNGPAMINYWTPENPTNDFPSPRSGATFSSYNGSQSLLYVDGSYFKIKNISFGYTLPQKYASKIHAGNLRVYATGSNILTVAKNKMIKSYDPERGGAESAPLSKQFVFGINLDL